MDLTRLDLNGGGEVTYNTEPVPPLRKVWIGFVLAFAFLVAEFIDVGSDQASGAKLILMGTAIAGWFYWLACVQRFHTILNQISPYRAGVSTYPITPGHAVGYHFIPFYNFFWMFKWPMELSSFLGENSSVKMVHGAFLGLLIFLSLLLRLLFDGFVGLSLLFLVALYISRKIRQAVDEHESVRGAAGVFA